MELALISAILIHIVFGYFIIETALKLKISIIFSMMGVVAYFCIIVFFIESMGMGTLLITASITAVVSFILMNASYLHTMREKEKQEENEKC